MSEFGPRVRGAVVAVAAMAGLAIGCSAEEGQPSSPDIPIENPDDCGEMFFITFPSGIESPWAEQYDDDRPNQGFIVRTYNSDIRIHGGNPEDSDDQVMVRPRNSALAGEQGGEQQAAAWESLSNAIDCFAEAFEVNREHLIFRARDTYREGHNGAESAARNRTATIASRLEEEFGMTRDPGSNGEELIPVPEEGRIQLIFFDVPER